MGLERKERELVEEGNLKRGESEEMSREEKEREMS